MENESIFEYNDSPTRGTFAFDANIKGCNLADMTKFVDAITPNISDGVEMLSTTLNLSSFKLLAKSLARVSSLSSLLYLCLEKIRKRI